MTVLEHNVEVALESADTVEWLHAYLRGMLDSGREREELLGVLENVHAHFREQGQEQFADFALDGMDFLTGWCAPGMTLPAPSAA